MLVKKLDWESLSANNANLSQIRAVGVTDKNVLRALRVIDRREFVPTALTAMAYSDDCVECEPGRSMLSFQATAEVLQFVNPSVDSKVLLVGGNYGYLAAVLSVMGIRPYIVESSDALAAECRARLKKYPIADFHVNGLRSGMPEDAPFDLIVMEVGGNHVPGSLKEQLVNGGKIVTCACSGARMVEIYSKTNSALTLEYSFPTNMATSPEMTVSW